ncbi:neprilysin-2-like [Belonocnema kinseyi]|uniref:neprilysin-2-like n=1 Tax=Belonocnema kinseyi TaxID=2817044 RepID=UPI00143CFC2E|nr:neprilysin-2-like [Belonocnema kinseyi]
MKKGTSAKQENSNVCQTLQCKNAANTIRESIDPEVSPCDNFYKFACGNFLKTTHVSKDKMSVDSYSPLHPKIVNQLKSSIEEPVQTNEPRFITLLKNFYNACLKMKVTEKNARHTLIEKLKNMGGWPLLEGDSWKAQKFDWEQASCSMVNEGLLTDSLFAFDIVTDFKDSTKNVLDIDQPMIRFDRDALVKGFSDKSVKDYFRNMVETAVKYGANKAKAENELRDVLDFEIELTTITLREEERHNQTALENLMTVKNLTTTYPFVHWKKYFNTILKSAFVIGDEEVIKVSVPTFFAKLGPLLKKTPKKVLANYLVWQVLEGQIQGSFSKEECLSMASEYLSVNSGAIYVRKYFTPKSKKSAEVLAVSIKQQFIKMLKKVDWMDEKTRTSALAKLKSMKNVIGYPAEILNDKTVDEYFKKLEITPNDLVQANANLDSFLTDHSFSNLRKTIEKSDWPWVSCARTTIDIRTDYDEHLNRLYVPAGILQDIFFYPDRPQYLNYGGVGAFVIGNKLTTAFDNKGRQYDQNGNLRDWWSPGTTTKFLQKAACITQQYKKYTVKDGSMNSSGTKVDRKNIADNGGVKMAYLAYQDWVKRNGPEPTLPGLKYSQSQLFWIQAAMTQCAKYTPEYLKDFITNPQGLIDDLSTPSEFRVTGVFANMPEFATDFSCKAGTKMNPVKKCFLW